MAPRKETRHEAQDPHSDQLQQSRLDKTSTSSRGAVLLAVHAATKGRRDDVQSLVDKGAPSLILVSRIRAALHLVASSSRIVSRTC